MHEDLAFVEHQRAATKLDLTSGQALKHLSLVMACFSQVCPERDVEEGEVKYCSITTASQAF
jgi:hypothetical protein